MLVIGDVHSRHKALDKLLKETWNGSEQIVFTGDFNDAEVPDSSFLKVWALVKPLFKQGIARAPQSNHCERLLGHLNGNNRGDKDAFGATVSELKGLDSAELEEIRLWLQGMPIGLVVDELDKRWAFYHACPSDKMHIAINGPHSKKQRVGWWLNTSLSPLTNWVVGHYGLLEVHHNGKGLIVLVDTPKEENAIAWFRTTTQIKGKVYANSN